MKTQKYKSETVYYHRMNINQLGLKENTIKPKKGLLK